MISIQVGLDPRKELRVLPAVGALFHALMFKAVVIAVIERSAPSGTRVLLLPPGSQGAVVCGGLHEHTIPEQVQIDGQADLVCTSRVAIRNLTAHRTERPWVAVRIANRDFVSELVRLVDQPGDQLGELFLLLQQDGHFSGTFLSGF